MGIPRLFAWLYKNYPQCLHAIKQYENVATKGITIDSYSLDLNAIIHPVCQKMYKYGGREKNQRLLVKYKRPQVNQKAVFAEVCNVIEALRELVSPKKEFIIAIDGTAGMGKQSQQRQRRFKSASEKSHNSEEFDSNCITTGSQFMYDLSSYIHVYIKRQTSSNPEWRKLSVLFSNEKVIGEGEHKIIRHIEKNKNKNYTYCIHSPDADLIMLSVPLSGIKIYIIRENIYSHIDCKYFLVDVEEFKNTMYTLLRWVSPKHQCVQNSVCYDFVVLCFLLGNDFLPHIKSLEISNDGLDVLLETYPRIASLHGHVTRKNAEGKVSLNTTALHYFFYALSTKENALLYKKATDKTINFPDTMMQSCITRKIKEGGKSEEEFDFLTYRDKYYKETLNIHTEDQIKKLCSEYFNGMLFVLRYYIHEMPDWKWYYPYHYAPLFTDMYKYIEEFNGDKDFVIGTPLTPLQQLLSVLPPQSSGILPVALRPLLQPDSVISDFYPLEFKVDLEGKHQEWEGNAILPFIDADRLVVAYDSVKNGLSEDEIKRDIRGKTTVYKYDENNNTTKIWMY
jgi:5'-3' exonuclease